jgi:hypothetical protein
MLAMIVRNIAIPAAELGVAPPPPPPPPPAPAPEPVTPAPTPKPAAPTPVAPEPKPAAKPTVSATVAPEPKPAAKKPEPAKPAPEKPAEKAAAKKPESKKPEPKKPEPKKPEPKKPAEPARWWVQVAGGANVDDLPKAWNALTAKSSALKGRQAWTTPLRFTNRLLTGPFASGAEAQAFVNTLGKSGQSAFSFQSEAGQKVTRLPAK